MFILFLIETSTPILGKRYVFAVLGDQQMKQAVGIEQRGEQEKRTSFA